jgi:hypothetical protein
MLARFGAGPVGRRCGDCQHVYVSRRVVKLSSLHNIYACRVQRADAPGIAGSREPVFALRWPTCGRFEQRERES